MNKPQETVKYYIISWIDFNSREVVRPPILFREYETAKAMALIIYSGCADEGSVCEEELMQ